MTVPLSPSLSPSVFLLQNHSDVFFSFFTDICSNEAIKSRESDSFSPSPHTDVENCFFFFSFLISVFFSVMDRLMVDTVEEGEKMKEFLYG